MPGRNPGGLLAALLAGAPLLAHGAEPAAFAWRSIGPGGGGWLPSLAVSPHDSDVVYAGCDVGGFFKSADGGEICRSDDDGFTWRVVGRPETGLPDGGTWRLIVDPDSPPAARRIYACVNRRGIFCSEDGGASWQARNQGLPGASVRSLAQHPRDPKVLFALLAQGGTDLGGVFRSDDRGRNWLRLSGAFFCPDAKSLAVAPSDPRRLDVSARRAFANDRKTHPGGVFASSDGGLTREQVLDDPFVQALAVDPRDAGHIYAGGTAHPYRDDAIGRGILGSRDGGRTWGSLNSPGLACRNIGSLTVDPHNPSRIYAGTSGNGVFVGDASAER